MDSGSPHLLPEPPPPAMQPDRPPGGTRRSGHKTPRKVQWQVEEPSQPSGLAQLDERGLDQQAFQELKDALEQHRDTTPSTSTSTSPNQRLSTAITPDSSIPVSPDMSPHEVPGEHYIDSNETAGLPGTNVERYSQVQAEKVVRAHRRGLFGALGFGRASDSESEHRHRRERSHSRDRPRRHRRFFLGGDSDVPTDVEKQRPRAEDRSHSPDSPRPNGVLSALLSLYDHNGVSGVSTPARSSFDDSKPPSIFGATSSVTDAESVAPPVVPVSSRAEPFASANASMTSLKLPRARTLASLGESRMPATRSGAGVFGPLIASTGNITGAAAPTASTVAPNIKRPGYHLSRYSLDDVPTKSAAKRKPLQRSRSSHSLYQRSMSIPEADLHTLTDSPTPEDHLLGDRPPSMFSHGRTKWTEVLRDLPKGGWRSRAETPTASTPGTPTDDEWITEKKLLAEERKREKRKRRKKAEIYITRHVAEIVQRQEFILRFARAMMMFGGPTHRLQAQVQATAKVLDIELSCMYLPDVMLVSFDDSATGTSNLKLIRQGSALDIGKLQNAYKLYWKVIHDEISVKDASVELDQLMRKPPLYRYWQLVLVGGFCSAMICSVSFSGSFVDSLVSFPLGCLLIVIQLFTARNELYSNVFEITVATLFSFIAAALDSTPYFCYSAIAASSIVLILPGYIVLCGSLELSSRNIVSGAVRVCFSLIYSLFLGFGLAIGATAYTRLTHHRLSGADDISCSVSHNPNGPWWQRTPSVWWAFLTVPGYSLFLSLRNHAPWNRKELLLLIAVSSAGWVTNHFVGLKFPGQSDFSAAVGALAVGFLSNLYGKFFRGNAFVIMITGILFQLPSGLANGGLFTFASQSVAGSNNNTSYLSGFQTALQLVSVSIGLTVGLGISLVLIHPIGSRRRAGGVFSL
ncbi:DUF1212-domain-containing protein [Obba rivulosa]|uniref:DUF1212-domain-containing protein n=1 Tax=Obba rivulosa TaxID=1052685 RepID=A0A8E2DN39_9APHY|nr:DUF1212-domain-containing protein [Obba rivulosa]